MFRLCKFGLVPVFGLRILYKFLLFPFCGPQNVIKFLKVSNCLI
jgi:hypothetical protein